MALTNQEITQSEIALLKCITAKDFERWLEKYNNSYPLYASVKEKYDDKFFLENKTLSGYKKYVRKFPNGKHLEEAQLQIIILEGEKERREKKSGEQTEQIGFIIILCIFLLVLLGPVIAGGWSIGETFAAAVSLTPLYYGIHSITKNRK